MDKYLFDYIKHIYNIDEKEINSIKNSFGYAMYCVSRSFNELADTVIDEIRNITKK